MSEAVRDPSGLRVDKRRPDPQTGDYVVANERGDIGLSDQSQKRQRRVIPAVEVTSGLNRAPQGRAQDPDVPGQHPAPRPRHPSIMRFR